MCPLEILENNQMNNSTIPKRECARTYLNYIIFTLNNHVGRIGDQKLNEAGGGGGESVCNSCLYFFISLSDLSHHATL